MGGGDFSGGIFQKIYSFRFPPHFLGGILGGFIGVGAKKSPAEPDFTLKLLDTHEYYYNTTYNIGTKALIILRYILINLV